jgi:hypothetical protein
MSGGKMGVGVEISNKTGIALFCWYAIIFCVGAFLLLDNMIRPDIMDSEVSLGLAFWCAVGAALSSCSVYYIRKLYKDLFQSAADESVPCSKFMLATVMYFVSRPLFAAMFAILVVISGVALIHATTTHGTKLSVGFVFFTVLVSAYGAAVTGRVINHLEDVGMDKLRNFGGLT